MSCEETPDYTQYSEDELLDLLEEIDYVDNQEIIKNLENKFQFRFQFQFQDQGSPQSPVCEQCGSGAIVEDFSEGIVVCTTCGQVKAEVWDSNPEWKQFEDGKEVVGRCTSTNYFLPQSSLGTTIACSSWSRLGKLHQWSAMPHRERSLFLVLKEIESKCREAKILTCIADDAKILFNNISECKHIKGKNKGKSIIIRGANRKALIAACIYYACKRKGKTRTSQELARLFGIRHKDMRKGCKIFLKLMRIRKMEHQINTSIAEHFIPRYCRELHISDANIDKIINVARNIQKLNICSVHTPYSVAPASILLVLDVYKISMNPYLVAKKFEVTESTLQKTYAKVETFKKVLISDELTDNLVKIMQEARKSLRVPSSFEKKYQQINFNDTAESKCALLQKIIDEDDDLEIDEDINEEDIFRPFDPDSETFEEYIHDVECVLEQDTVEINAAYQQLMAARC